MSGFGGGVFGGREPIPPKEIPPAMPLTDSAIRAAKPKEKPYKLADAGGLYLVVGSSSKLWRFKYRIGGKEKVLSIGAYPSVPLAMARESRDAAKALLAKGGDPSQAKQDAKKKAEAEAEHSFSAIAAEYVEKLRREGRADATITKVEWLLSLLMPALGTKPIRTITAPMVLEALRNIERRGRHETAKRARSTAGSVFRYAIATQRADTDPTFALRGALTAPQTKSRAAILQPQAFGGMLRAIKTFDGQITTRAALQLMALLFPRPGELRMAEWSEFDLAARVWTIPAARTKMRRPHRVPLSAQAVAILEELRPITGSGRLVFPSIRSNRRCMSENTLNAALRRLGYDKEQASAHGFRATASTLLNESGKWSSDAIERQLAHVENNDVRRAYARGEHWDERVAMMSWWGTYLDKLREGGAVIPFKKKSRST
jgi:integrase